MHKFMSIPLPLLTLNMLLLFFLIPSLVFKLLIYIKRSIYSEKVAGKVVLITGASSGIGEQLAYEYGRRGARLFLVDIREDRLGAVADKARRLGSPDVATVGADVSNVQICKGFVDEAVSHFGKLDHFVNSAGIAKYQTIENWARVSNITPFMEVNFWGTVYATRFAIPHLRKTRGKIIVIASAAGLYPLPRLGFYNASKAALISFCETLRTEVGSSIGMTIVTPGLINSELSQAMIRETFLGQCALSAESCAKAIVNSTCHGDVYLTEPSWVRVLFLLKVLCPEIVEWWNRFLDSAMPWPLNSDVNNLKEAPLPCSCSSPEAQTNVAAAADHFSGRNTHLRWLYPVFLRLHFLPIPCWHFNFTLKSLISLYYESVTNRN